MTPTPQGLPESLGLPSQLLDLDPAETQEWRESLDAVVDHAGPNRARYLMLSMLQRAREQQRRRAEPAQHRLHQHHPAGAGAGVPRRRAHRAADPRLHPLERRDHGAPGAAARDRRRRAHLHLRLRRVAVRGRASTTSSAATTQPAAATRSTSRATPPRASTRGRSWRAG